MAIIAWGLVAAFVVCVTGAAISALLFSLLQKNLEAQLALSYDVQPVATGRRAFWNVGLATALHGALFAGLGFSGMMLATTAIAALFSINNRLHRLFGRVLSPGDTSSLREALVFLPSYLGWHRIAILMAGAVGVLCGIGLLGHYADAWLNLGSSLPTLRLVLLVSCGAFLAVAWSYARNLRNVFTGSMAYSPTDQNQNARRLGFVLQGWLVLTGTSSPTKPNDFEQRIEGLVQFRRTVAQPDDRPDQRPDIIFLMMESLSDLAEIGVPLTAEPLAYLKGNGYGRARGKLRVSTIGGNTCNTEFEVLTGISVSQAGSRTLPYMGRLNDGVYGLPQCLRRHGYVSLAVHPFHRWFYNRDRAYRKLGFDEFIADEGFIGANQQFNRISDKAFADVVLSKLSPNQPSFVFGVSIMGHGPYPAARDRKLRFVNSSFMKGQETQAVMDLYCEVMAASDQAIADLHRKLEDRGRPYVLALFGDHVPVFSPNLDGIGIWKNILKEIGQDAPEDEVLYQTPLFVFSNVEGVVSSPFGCRAASDLGAEILGRLGVGCQAVFGSLRSQLDCPRSSAAYAYDTLFGEQILTRDLVRVSDAGRYDMGRDAYVRYNASTRLVNTLHLLTRERRYEEFDALYATLQPDDPQFASARLLWAALQIERGRTDADVEQGLAGVIASSNPYWGLYHRIRLYLARGDHAATAADVAAAVAAAPDRAPELVRLAQGRFAEKDFAGALAILDPLVERGVPSAEADLLWAMLRIEMGSFGDEVEAALGRAAQAGNTYWALYHRIRLYLARGDHAGVSADAAAAVAAEPDRVPNLVRFAQGRYAEKDFAGALAILDPLVEGGVASAEADLLWAMLRIEAGAFGDEVEAALGRAVRAGNGYWAHYHRARLYLARGDHAAAAADIAAAEKINPGSMAALRNQLEASSKTEGV